MSNSLQIYDLASAITHQRLHEAAQHSLLAQLPAAARPGPLSHLPALIRLSVAEWLRALTMRRDRSPDRHPVLACAAAASK